MHHWHVGIIVSCVLAMMSSAVKGASATRSSHGVRRLFPDLSSLHTTLETYARHWHSNTGDSEEFANLWHPLSMRKYVDPTGTLINMSLGDDNFAILCAANADTSDFSILSLDFISPLVCAVKVQASIGKMRFTNIVSLMRGPSKWQIVQELSSVMDMSTTPSGCILTPINVPVPVPIDYEGVNDEEAFEGIRQTAQTYLTANHVSDVGMMRTCMDPSTVLFSVDAATSQITGRPANEYFTLMGTRAGSTIEAVMQYDAVLKIDRVSRDSAVATVTLGLPQLDGRLFTDQLFMLRCKESDGKRRWVIVNKSWTLHQAPKVHVIPPAPPLPNSNG